MTVEIDWKTIFLLHRAPDGHIAFGKKDAAGKWNNLFSLSRETWMNLLPSMNDYFLDYLGDDLYMTLNSPFAAAGKRDKKTGEIVLSKNPLTGLPDVRRGKGDFRYINCCNVDLDFYKQDSAPEVIEASNQVRKMALAGVIPYPSIFLFTGRGLCLIWLVKEPGGGINADNLPMPQRDFREREYTERAELINRVLVNRFKNQKPDLIPDASCTPINQFTRVPGSLNLKSGQKIQADITIVPGGKGLFYTLGQLSEMLEIFPGHELEQKKYRKIKNRYSKPDWAKNWWMIPTQRIWDLKEIERQYDGFPQGMRCKALMFFAHFYLGEKTPLKDLEIIQKMDDVAARCRPPYPSDGNDQRVKDIFLKAKNKRKRWTNRVICECLKISYERALEFGLDHIIPKELADERKAQKKKEAGPGPRERARIAREIYYKQRLAQGGRGLSCRTIAKELKSLGISSNPQTVNVEFKKIKKEWELSLKKKQ